MRRLHHELTQNPRFQCNSWLPMKGSRIGALLQKYGRLALIIYFVMFALVLLGFASAIESGFEPESAAGQAGLWGSAWLATKATQPLRIAGTLALTPLLAAALQKLGWWSPPTAKTSDPQ